MLDGMDCMAWHALHEPRGSVYELRKGATRGRRLRARHRGATALLSVLLLAFVLAQPAFLIFSHPLRWSMQSAWRLSALVVGVSE
eukprot:GSA25T00013048001.1